MSFRLTYATMFDPPDALHVRFEAALDELQGQLGRRHPLYIAGRDLNAGSWSVHHSPIHQQLLIGEFALAGADDVERAMHAAHTAWPAWRDTPWQERCRLLRAAADLMEQRVYLIAAALCVEVGKNRMEALGEAQETVDFFRHYADDMEAHGGFDVALPDDPIAGWTSHNRSCMRPHGVWAVIAPFNFPLALAGGPAAAALVTGNTVVLKGATDTPWAGRLLADCVRDAGFPPGVFNYLSGSGADVGAAMVADPRIAGLTFTGSVAVGRELIARMNAGRWPKPCIAEMGGKNACIVTARADLERAAAGIVRSAYGMSGQKCSALSRLYVDATVADELVERLRQRIATVSVGDPRRREHWLGTVINRRAYDSYTRGSSELAERGARLHAPGGAPREGDLQHGWYVAPLLAEAAAEDPFWQQELFLPILLMQRVEGREQAMRLANDCAMGLTAGFYGGEDEVPWFHREIEAGVTYANRPQGATTGAWPGYQPFGGWKGSGNTGKAIASFHYLAQYLREQSRTVVE